VPMSGLRRGRSPLQLIMMEPIAAATVLPGIFVVFNWRRPSTSRCLRIKRFYLSSPTGRNAFRGSPFGDRGCYYLIVVCSVASIWECNPATLCIFHRIAVVLIMSLRIRRSAVVAFSGTWGQNYGPAGQIWCTAIRLTCTGSLGCSAATGYSGGESIRCINFPGVRVLPRAGDARFRAGAKTRDSC